MATTTVATVQELTDALDAASGGDVIKLKPGQYGDLWLYNNAFDSEVVVMSEDPQNPAVFSSAKIQAMQNLTIRDVIVDLVPDENTLPHTPAVLISDSVSVKFEQSVVDGGVSVNGADPGAPAGSQGSAGILGEPTARGITILRSEDITIEDTEIFEFWKGIVIADSEGLQILGNNVHHLRGSPLVGAGLDDVLVEGNHFHDSFPWKLGGAGDHGDFVHFWIPKDQSGPSQNFIIRDNFFEQGNGEAIFGIYLEGNGTPRGFENVQIEDNVIHLGDSHGMSIGTADGLVIANNTLLQSEGGNNDAPEIILLEGVKNAVVKDNISAAVNESFNNFAENNIVTSGNVTIDYEDTESPYYVGNMFVDSAHSEDSLQNIRIVPGSPADGAGSRLTKLDETPDKVVAGFDVYSSASTPFDLIFDASDLTFGPNGLVDDQQAQFTWRFGDGFKASGTTVQRTFDQPGVYDVSLTVTTASGETSKATFQAGVSDPKMLTYDAALGQFFRHDYGTSEVASATIGQIVQSGGSKVIALGGTGVTTEVSRSEIDDIFGADNFELAFSLKATAGAASAGELFRVHGSFVAKVDGNGKLVFEMYPEDGSTLVSHSVGTALTDGAVHDVSVLFEGDEDRVTVMIDGKMVGTLRTSSQLSDDLPRDLVFGNPWGGTNFTGELHDFSVSSYSPDYKVFAGDPGQVDTTVVEDHGSADPFAIDGLILDIAGLEALETTLRDDARIIETDAGASVTFDGANDYVKLGGRETFDGSNQVSVSIDFTRSVTDDNRSKLFWNKDKIGVKLFKDDLILGINTAEDGFTTFRVKDTGIEADQLHNVIVIADGDTDRVQVLLDGVVILDERDTDLHIADVGQSWNLSAPGIRAFDGEISDFRLDDEANFVDDFVFTPEMDQLL